MSCEKHNTKKITGEYKSKEYTALSRAWLHYVKKTDVAMGTTLKLERDSTFFLQNCGNILTGKWKTEMDTLILAVETNRWKNDSLNINGFNGKHPSIPQRPVKYLIKKNELIQKEKVMKDGKEKILINHFEKIFF
ncbi:MAG TPA: hypothetical protein ENJ53_05245 [Phaeodactylibacter sp.]|nr:hypothetical protein [Phaeodactylibacter sp.]